MPASANRCPPSRPTLAGALPHADWRMASVCVKLSHGPVPRIPAPRRKTGNGEKKKRSPGRCSTPHSHQAGCRRVERPLISFPLNLPPGQIQHYPLSVWPAAFVLSGTLACFAASACQDAPHTSAPAEPRLLTVFARFSRHISLPPSTAGKNKTRPSLPGTARS